jgi:hypothetical protein
VSALGRKYEHPGPTRTHAPITNRGISAAQKVLLGIIVLALIGTSWGLLAAGGLFWITTGIGEALP